MITQIIKDGPKNFSLLIKGFIKKDFDATPLFEIGKLTPPTGGWKGLRLDAAVWAIQEKMGLVLWWSKPEGEHDLILPMESRNAMRFDEGLDSPRVEKGWRGILHLSSFRVEEPPMPKRFFVLLDFDKQ
jgi:hypothetical protein